MFFTVVGCGILLLSSYLGWRVGSVRWLARLLPAWARAAILVLLGSSYIAARFMERAGWPTTARVLEIVGAYWIGSLLLLCVAVLAADVLTVFGLVMRRRAAAIRSHALVAGAALVVLAVVQGHRAPVVRDYEVRLAGLPQERDGLSVVFISDLHLGSMLGEDWLASRVAQVAALHPDVILVGGDILEGDSPSENRLVPLLGQLSAPLGVWTVAGNHEYHGGASSLRALESHGFRVLRSEWKQLVPGLVLAGIDNGREGHDERPQTQPARPRRQPSDDPLARALADRPANQATILVSHMPTRVEEASRMQVGLMLSGHTHDGQIWPFRYVVRMRFPYLAGIYDVGGMPLIVCRGTGTFGPRMRLWYPSEIVRVTLRSRRAGAPQDQ